MPQLNLDRDRQVYVGRHWNKRRPSSSERDNRLQPGKRFRVACAQRGAER
jgi:hypothetical protein